MDRLRTLSVAFVVSVAIALAWADSATAQIRVQDTPALNGLGTALFKDISIQLDAGYGNDSPIRESDELAATRRSAGIFIDKAIIADILEIAYDRDLYLGNFWERDTWTRDLLIEPFRVVAHYRVGNFDVLRGSTIKEYTGEFYVGVRYKLDLDRLFRHVPMFQR